MKTILSSRRDHYLARVSIFLITAALIAGMVGCVGGGYTPSQNLEIRTWYDLDNVRNNLAGTHTLMNDLNSTTPGYQELAGPTANGGKGWEPIGFVIPGRFHGISGTFDGQGHEIRDLFINRPDEISVGLFSVAGALIRNVLVMNATVTGGACGGLVGWNENGTVSNCYCSGKVTGDERVGGLIGNNCGPVNNSYFTGSVTGNSGVGGLMGYTFDGPVSDCYSTGSVIGNSRVGGLAGFNQGCTVSNSYSTASVSGQDGVGGLVGVNGGGSVSDCYATGSVVGNVSVGGLVGSNAVLGWTGTVNDCYATGSVVGNVSVGGLVGSNAVSGWTGTVNNSFWDTETSGQNTSDGGTGKTTAQMQDIATFSGAAWNITAVALNETNPSYIWNIVNNVTYPFLSWQP